MNDDASFARNAPGRDDFYLNSYPFLTRSDSYAAYEIEMLRRVVLAALAFTISLQERCEYPLHEMSKMPY